MTKDVLEKILTPGGVLAATDLTATEKAAFYGHLIGQGMTGSTAYNRLFKEGFQPWELDGIDRLRTAYLDQMECDGGGDVTAWRSLTDDERAGRGAFWNFLGAVKHRTRFSQFMADAGMRSAVTVAKRFGSDDWKPWEQRGIKAVLSEFGQSSE